MIRLPVAIALLVLSISACARNSPPPVAAPQPATKPAAAAPAAPKDTGPTSQTSESQQATASQESTGEEAADDKRDASLERLAAMPADQQLPAGTQWKAGVNYTPLVPAQPTNVAAGKVEVVEVFWFGCPHCYALEPFVLNWLKNKPEYVEFVRVPVMWGPVHRMHAKLFYVLESLGRKDLDEKVFETIHKEQKMLVGNDEPSTEKMQLDFAVANGIKAEDFKKAWDSFAVNSNLQRAQQLTERYHVDGVPLFVVNGKYETDVSKAGGSGQLLQLLNDLAASEKRR